MAAGNRCGGELLYLLLLLVFTRYIRQATRPNALYYYAKVNPNPTLM